MPWNNDEGPWGSGNGSSGKNNNNNPWNNNNNNIDDIIKSAKEKANSLLPGGKKGISLILIAVFAIWMVSGFYTVGPEEQGVVLRFGKYIETTTSGLNYHLPIPIEKVTVVPVTTTRNIEIGFRKG